ncbi:DUF3048 domain-containing protein [Cellulomonas sp.]|uniref:DUF3048 domain-containing protein n=1 Tax=Cellulomonas sp. TaxID=40001 RepID=UPI002585FDD2|nr:DUF3048 domain-containing protein [Cellulomonas sp.]MCR6687906.1 DUF3048 domain-containing protein [Cellulomonas sp.]
MTPRSIRRGPSAPALRVVGLVGVLALALVGCSGDPEPQETPSPVVQGPTIDPDKQPVPTPSVAPVWPLTGVAVKGTAKERPALAVKIENTSAARPQTGLEDADVVWETIVEFQVSRFVAVYHSHTPAEIGPIRSVRPMDPLILAPTNGLLAFSGGQRGILELAQASGLQLLSNDAGVAGMYRSADRPAPHNVYGDPKTFWGLANSSHSAAPGAQFLFARTADEAAAVAEGKPAKTLAFRLSAAASPTWTWQSSSRTWLRSEGSSPAVARSGERLAATNVVSIVANHPDTRYPAQGGARVPTYDLVGSGTGTIATGGRTVEVTWKKAAQDKPLRLFLPGGEPALLAPGNTWVELVPKGSGSLTVS